MDDDWNSEKSVIIKADERLDDAQKAIIETDFGMFEGQLVVPSRMALVKYVIQRYQIDPRSLNQMKRRSRSWWRTSRS